MALLRPYSVYRKARVRPCYVCDKLEFPGNLFSTVMFSMVILNTESVIRVGLAVCVIVIGGHNYSHSHGPKKI